MSSESPTPNGSEAALAAVRDVVAGKDRRIIAAIKRGRSNATQAGLALCVEWTTWCRNSGWAEEHLLELEGLFWKYRDAEGKLKAPNNQAHLPATAGQVERNKNEQ